MEFSQLRLLGQSASAFQNSRSNAMEKKASVGNDEIVSPDHRVRTVDQMPTEGSVSANASGDYSACCI